MNLDRVGCSEGELECAEDVIRAGSTLAARFGLPG